MFFTDFQVKISERLLAVAAVEGGVYDVTEFMEIHPGGVNTRRCCQFHIKWPPFSAPNPPKCTCRW